ncbi:MAG TPA: penicillin-binding protein 2 [Mycobacteriales bacterium]|nr:penicillin-binding protein 2 [Mycobacteriales bacterium]
MNAPLRRLSIALGLLFLALLVNATVVQVGQAHTLNHRADNPRPLLTRLTTDRGQIQLGGDGTVLAASFLSKDGRTYDRVYSPDPTTHQEKPEQAEMYAAVTGWAGVISTQGIEQSEDDLLSGNDDRLAIRNFTDTLAGKQKQGGSVVLTIDKAGQQAAYNSLKNALGGSGNSGAVVALDAQTGAVLALVTLPTYDPNPIASRDGAAAQQAYNALLKQPGNPLLDRATQNRYPPGSMFKVITSATALSDGYTPSTRVDAPATYTPPLTNVAIPNFAGELCGSGGKEPLTEALATSCNTAFAKLGVKLGQNKLQAQASAFGIGQPTPPFPLPWVRSTFASGELDPPALAQSAIGQRDVALTPLQAAMVVQAIANGGHLITPYLVARELAPDRSQLSEGHGTDGGNPVSAQVATELTTMMQAVVDHGTAAGAGFNPALKVAGKTGTAQHGTGLPPDTWFAGFNTAGNRKVAVVAFVENGGTRGAAAQGATVAAPIVRDVINALVTPPGQ